MANFLLWVCYFHLNLNSFLPFPLNSTARCRSVPVTLAGKNVAHDLVSWKPPSCQNSRFWKHCVINHGLNNPSVVLMSYGPITPEWPAFTLRLHEFWYKHRFAFVVCLWIVPFANMSVSFIMKPRMCLWQYLSFHIENSFILYYSCVTFLHLSYRHGMIHGLWV